MNNGFGLAIESLVAVLLLLTIGYCVLLNSRLKRLRADEFALKATISELITATEIAERAIAGLKLTVRECDQTLGERLRSAERFSAEIQRQLDTGEDVVRKLAQIVRAARPDAAGSGNGHAASQAHSYEPVQPTHFHNDATAHPAAAANELGVPLVAPDTKATVLAAQAFVARTRSRMREVA